MAAALDPKRFGPGLTSLFEEEPDDESPTVVGPRPDSITVVALRPEARTGRRVRLPEPPPLPLPLRRTRPREQDWLASLPAPARAVLEAARMRRRDWPLESRVAGAIAQPVDFVPRYLQQRAPVERYDQVAT